MAGITLEVPGGSSVANHLLGAIDAMALLVGGLHTYRVARQTRYGPSGPLPGRIARLMRRAGIAGRVPRRYRRTTVGDPFTQPPDLVQRDFTPTHPDELWVGDITYVRTWEGWLYLSTIIDCFSRRVFGWAMADHLRTERPLTALHMALARRNPSGTLIHHTDRLNLSNTRRRHTPTSSTATAFVRV
jgi:transposase InsO family protein